MVDRDEDDLFKHTSMTFGEHLEELRSSLFKAVLCMAVGFGIGLLFGRNIVQMVQSPLETALKEYYSQESLDKFNERVPPEMRNDPAIQKLVFEDSMKPEEVFIAPGTILEALQAKYPDQFKGIQLPAAAPEKAANEIAAAAEPTGKPASPERQPSLTKKDMIRLFLWRPMSDDERLKLDALNVQEPFMIYIKAGFVSGIVMSSPFAFYFLWSFVAAGLYPHEKKYVHMFLPVSIGLFLCGAALAFFFVFPPVLGFFFNISKSLGYEMRPRISEWLSFVLLLPLGFGISFQLPLIMLFLERIHIFTVATYMAKWRIAVLLMAVASMVLSPGGDPYSMMMMLVPLVGLYFGGILLCKWLPSDRANATARAKEYAAID